MVSTRARTLLGAALLLGSLTLSIFAGLGSAPPLAGLPHEGSSPSTAVLGSGTRGSGAIVTIPAGSAVPSVHPAETSTRRPQIVHATANVGFKTNPWTCGSISYNGSLYTNGALLTSASTGAWPVSATPCSGWTTVSITGSGAVQVHAGTAYVNGTWGNITARFTGPMYTVNVTTTPASCGYVRLNGTKALNGQTYTTSPGQFNVTATPCPGWYTYSLTGTAGVSISSSLATIIGNGNIAAVFQPSTFWLEVFSQNPTNCGGVTIGSVSMPANGPVKHLIQAGTYAYATWSCTGYNLTGVSAEPNPLVAVSPNLFPETGNVTVLANGTFNLTFAPKVFALTFLDQPGGYAGSITFGGVTYTNNTKIPVIFGTIASVVAVPAAHWQPTGQPFVVTGGVQWQLGGTQQTVVINASGDLIAQFIPIYYTVVFTTPQNPCSLSSINFNYSTFPLIGSNGARVKWGVYLISNPSCMGFSFQRYSGDANVGVSTYVGWVWVNGSGTVTVHFNPNWVTVSGWVEQWGTGAPIQGATVFIFYGGTVINQTQPTGASGDFKVQLVYGQYYANATAPTYTTAPQQRFFVNGTPTGLNGLIIWVNATLGLPSNPPGVAGFLGTYPGILVPIVSVVVVVAIVLIWQFQKKWNRPPPSPPPPAPAAGGPGPGVPPGPPLPAGGPGPGGGGAPALPPGRPPY